MVERQQEIVLQEDCEVQPRDRLLTPPFVVDPPAILHPSYGAWSRPLAAPYGGWLAILINLDAETCGEIQGS